MRPKVDGGEPDALIPSVEAYQDAAYLLEKLTVVGIKTTCKDRWRQVLNEATRVPCKHILTIQQGISAKQLMEMHRANVKLVVPQEIQRQYPKSTEIALLSVNEFINTVKRSLA